METKWNIEGIAREILREMKEDGADIGGLDNYVLRIAYRSVYSRVPEDAALVSAQVKRRVLELSEKEFDD